jgi:transcriptional regulator with XRE-family HTH domain/quercetin dioxygenase-like cupin family protein
MGPALRAARLRQKLSLRSVAADIGVSASLLSQVETGKTQPSVSTFYALVNRLGISVDQLFGFGPNELTKAGPRSMPGSGGRKPSSRATAIEASDGGSVVQRSGEHPTLEMEKGVIWELLTTGDRAVVDSLLVTYRPGASSSVSGRMMRHNGVEYAYLLDGVLTLKLEFDTYELHPGDSLSFDSTRPHQYVNNGDVDARGLWFVVGRQEMETSEQAAALLAQAGFGSTKG